MFDNLFNSAKAGDVLFDFLDQHYHHAENVEVLTNYKIHETGNAELSVEAYENNPETDRENKKSDYTLKITETSGGEDGDKYPEAVKVSGYVNNEKVSRTISLPSGDATVQPVIDYLEKLGEFRDES
jgi:hypothetical protein